MLPLCRGSVLGSNSKFGKTVLAGQINNKDNPSVFYLFIGQQFKAGLSRIAGIIIEQAGEFGHIHFAFIEVNCTIFFQVNLNFRFLPLGSTGGGLRQVNADGR